LVVAIAVDGSGNAYFTGQTNSSNTFPVLSAAQGVQQGGYDAFVAKLNPLGTALVYSTFLGGTGAENTKAIAVDSAGIAYVLGITDSIDLPLARSIYATYFG